MYAQRVNDTKQCQGKWFQFTSAIAKLTTNKQLLRRVFNHSKRNKHSASLLRFFFLLLLLALIPVNGIFHHSFSFSCFFFLFIFAFAFGYFSLWSLSFVAWRALEAQISNEDQREHFLFYYFEMIKNRKLTKQNSKTI